MSSPFKLNQAFYNIGQDDQFIEKLLPKFLRKYEETPKPKKQSEDDFAKIFRQMNLNENYTTDFNRRKNTFKESEQFTYHSKQLNQFNQDKIDFMCRDYNLNRNSNEKLKMKGWSYPSTESPSPQTLNIQQPGVGIQFNNFRVHHGIFHGSEQENSLPNSDFYGNQNILPKRNNSSDEIKKEYKRKGNSLFLAIQEREEKGEDFADLQQLITSIKGTIWDYAKTQRGSRNLQKLLNKIQPESIDELLEKLQHNFSELMTSLYGNYFCQKLIQSCSAEQRIFILKSIMNDFSEISCNTSGTHALQSMIEIINLPAEEDVVKEAVKKHILMLSFDVNGTHVMQKILTGIRETNREQINKTILENLHKLINDSNGVCVLKKFINSNINPSYKQYILNEVNTNSLEIIQNPFGNYIIQHILDEWGPESANETIDMIISNIVSLSMQKFSSNVVEKCFDLINMETRQRMVKELFNPSKISSLLKNKYGNFVLQKAIQVMTNYEKQQIREILAKRMNYTSNKEKARLTSLLEII